ncbi:phage protein [Sulfuriferula multivorans]|uniref:Phage protein n=2 Tax=Sulfuriferula multivorans TaxID=1559896 RepID=A0A401JF56_9PROT|nr:phage protein [Sulfuriferula multivorans]
MTRRNWKRCQPTSLRHAIELCKDHAKEVRNLSVERIAELMGEESHWTVYGWLRDGAMPLRKVAAYENVCRCDYITRWMAHSAGKMLIDIPNGRLTDATDVHALQGLLNGAVGALIAFAQGQSEANQVMGEVTHAMEGLAWHRANVAKAQQPELELNHE